MPKTHQMTGNAAVYHVARELSRRGWNVMLTVRNARGADLYAVNEDESVIIPIQSKGLAGRSNVFLGESLDKLRSPWWIVTTYAETDKPICYVLTLDEVKRLATRSNGKTPTWHLVRCMPKYAEQNYEREEFREAWQRLEAG